MQTIKETWDTFEKDVLNESPFDTESVKMFAHHTYYCGAKAMFELMRLANSLPGLPREQFIQTLEYELNKFHADMKESVSG